MLRCAWLATVVLLWGCTIRTKEPMKEMPRFGSSAQFATTGGFVTGRWRLFLDESTARYHMPEYGKALMANVDEEMEFTADGKVSFYLQRCTAHGQWVANGNGIDLMFTDVDGVPAAEAKAKEEKFRNSSRFYRNAHHMDYMRGATLSIASGIGRLELHEDKKRLFQPTPSTRSDGSTFMGTPTWLRE